MSVIQETLGLAKRLYKVFRTSDRSGQLQAINHGFDWDREEQIPTISLKELVGTSDRGSVSVALNVDHAYELPLTERVALLALVRSVEARTVFEFGTFTGATTIALAREVGQQGTVYTLDLPHEDLSDVPEVQRMVGMKLDERRESDARIVQIRERSTQFTGSSLEAKVDLAFIDASHQYDDVLNDSATALRMVREGGLIIWDDYQRSQPGVFRAVRKLARELPIRRLEGSRFAVLRVSRR